MYGQRSNNSSSFNTPYPIDENDSPLPINSNYTSRINIQNQPPTHNFNDVSNSSSISGLAKAKYVEESFKQKDFSGCEVTLFLSFENLPSMDLFSISDPYAVVSVITNNVEQKLGKTETLMNANSGSWVKSFDMRFVFEEQQVIKVMVYDYDKQKSDDFGGQATFYIGNVMATPGQSMRTPLIKKNKEKRFRGNLVVHIEKRKDGFCGSKLHLEMRGHKFASKDWGGLVASDPYFLFERNLNGSWIKVFKSEHIRNNNNPIWAKANLPLDKLCQADINAQLKLSVWDYDKGSQDDLIGETKITVQDLIDAQKSKKRIEMKHPPTKSKYKKKSYKHSGTVEVLKIQLVRNPTDVMLEYIAGGLQLNLVVAIDFTLSNGKPTNPNSLHHISASHFNAYQSAIKSIGDILIHYDQTGSIPAFGFGGVFMGEASHCFPLNGRLEDSRVDGVKGLLEAYNAAIHNVPLSGPTYFSPLLDIVTTLARDAEMSQNHQRYTTLLILTDGVINDMERTIEKLICASGIALSVVIVGIGNANFKQMEFLDSDDSILQHPTTLKRAKRDMVQFVTFNKCRKDKALLAKEVLFELPKQIVEHFQSRNITPNKPTGAPAVIPESLCHSDSVCF